MNHLKVESKLLADLKSLIKNHGFTKSVINELDDALLPFDPTIQACVKDLFHKAANERVKIDCGNKDISKTASNLVADEIEYLPRTKLPKNKNENDDRVSRRALATR